MEFLPHRPLPPLRTCEPSDASTVRRGSTLRSDLLSRLRRPMRALAIATFLGLALGYSAFYFVFPNVSVPASDEANLPLILGILLLAAVLGGLLTEDLPSSVIQAFASIPIGAVIAFSIAISPLATGFLEVQTDD